MTSAGDPSKSSDARDQIFNAVLGLVIMLASWMILNTINPQLVELKEPGLADEPAEPTQQQPTVVGHCSEGQTYNIKLYSGENYQPEGEPIKCYKPSESEKSFDKKINSINADGSVAIKLFDKLNFQGKSICFTSPEENLKNCYIDCPPGPSWLCTASWPNHIQSLKIISVGECGNPGKTIGADGISEDPNEICR